MSDSYQAIYDAVRSRISGGDISGAVRDVLFQQMDISMLKAHAQQEIYAVSHEYQRPSVVFRPRIFPDGNMWCALLGDDLASGVCGFGPSPAEACAEFDKAWFEKRPAAQKGAQS